MANSQALEKSALDDRFYRITTLPNCFEVLLIHDPNIDLASAALSVNVGSFSDPRNIPGIAHGVEHLLFMGTEKYPKDNEYNQYLASYSGSSNAYTASTSTNYFFELAASSSSPTSKKEVQPSMTPEDLPVSKEDSPLWGALDRFGQFFIAPLFLEDTLDRELNAVDSEHTNNVRSDFWRLDQLDRTLSNPDHPCCRFSTGNLETLRDDLIARDVDIRDEFMKFYSAHYSANTMKLVVLGRESLDTLEEWVEEIFSQVPNKGLPRKRWDDVPIYTDRELLIQTFVRPVLRSQSLELLFPYRDEEEYYESKPSRYLGHLIGHEGPGSILAYVKAKGWASGLDAGALSLCPGSGLFNILVELTEDGLKHYKEVTKIIFQYIAMIREQPPQKRIVDEMIRMSEVDFKWSQKMSSSQTTGNLAAVMQKPYDRKVLLSGPTVIRKFDADLLSQAMSYLRPDNFRLNVVSQDFPGGWDKKEKWYGTEYKSERIPEEFVKELQKAFENLTRPEELHFPHKNEFIPDILEVEKKKVDTPLKTPKIIRNDDGVRTWYKKDDQFWVPKASVNIIFRTPVPNLTSRYTAMSNLYCDLVKDFLAEYAYDAEISGLMYEINIISTGLTISIEGYNDKLYVLLEKVLVSLRDLVIREDRFKIMHEKMTCSFHNVEYGQPFHQVGTYSWWLKNEKGFVVDQLKKELEGVTAQDVQQFFPQMLAQCHIEILAHGNLHKEEALQITDLVEKTLKPKRLPLNEQPFGRSLILPPGSNFIYERQLKDPANVNHCIEYMLYLGNPVDKNLRAKILLIAQMTGEPAYNQLRTIEQLGYVVFSGSAMTDTWAGYQILIQSEKDCRYLEDRIEHFLTMFEKTLDEMSEDEFEGHKKAVINERLEKLKNLAEEGNRFWNRIFNNAYDFLSTDEDVKFVEPLTKKDLQKWYAHYISPSSLQRAKLSVHLIAQAKSGEPTPEEKKDQAIAQCKIAPETIANGDVVKDGNNGATSVLIINMKAWKASLQISAGMCPVDDLSKF